MCDIQKSDNYSWVIHILFHFFEQNICKKNKLSEFPKSGKAVDSLNCDRSVINPMSSGPLYTPYLVYSMETLEGKLKIITKITRTEHDLLSKIFRKSTNIYIFQYFILIY